jgi:hypothetical protein
MRVVQTVHNSIGTGAHIVRTLRDIAKDEKELLPAFAHFKSAM